MQLLSEWLDILYGNGTAERVDPEGRLRAIMHRRVEANRPYYEGDSDTPHYAFVDPMETLIAEVSADLPLYSELMRRDR